LLPPKKVTNFYEVFYEQQKNNSSIFGECKGPLTLPQAEGNAKSRLYSRGRIVDKPFSCAAIMDCRKIDKIKNKK